MYSIKKLHVNNVVVVSIVFLISLVVAPYYINGDQSAYIKVYNALESLSIQDGYRYYSKYLTSTEVTYFILVWISSRIIEKSFFVSISNAVLAYLLLKLLTKWRVYFGISVLLVLSNYYIYVLFFAAEKLKFAFIFFILSMLVVERMKLFSMFAAVSMLSHFQMIIMYASIIIDHIYKAVKTILYSGSLKISLLFVLIGAIFIPLLFGRHLAHKISHHFELHSFYELSKILILLTLSIYYSKNSRLRPLITFFPLVVAALLLSGDRVNMIGYFVFMYYSLQINKGFNMGVILTAIYFSLKNYYFLEKIMRCGQGFCERI